MADSHRSLAFEAAAHVLRVTAQAWGVQLPAGSRAVAPARRLTDRLTAYRDRRVASPSRLRLSAHGFDISY